MSSKKGHQPSPADIAQNLNIGMLQQAIDNLEDTKRTLTHEIKELKAKLVQQKADQADIYYYLNKKCDESFEVVSSLEEQLLSEQTDRELSEKIYEARIDELKGIIQANDNKFNAKVTDYESKLEMLNSYNEYKQESEDNLQRLMKTLSEERSQFAKNAENMENSFLLEREKLRKSYDLKYDNIKRDLEKSVDGKLTKKTKKTQIMNIIMKKELDNQSQHAEKLLEINESILEKNRKLELELKISQSLQDESVLRINMLQRVVKELNEQSQKKDEEYSVTVAQFDEKYREKDEKIALLESQLASTMAVPHHISSEREDILQLFSLYENSIFPERKVTRYEEEQVVFDLVKTLFRKHPYIKVKVAKFFGQGKLSSSQVVTKNSPQLYDSTKEDVPAKADRIYSRKWINDFSEISNSLEMQSVPTVLDQSSVTSFQNSIEGINSLKSASFAVQSNCRDKKRMGKYNRKFKFQSTSEILRKMQKPSEAHSMGDRESVADSPERQNSNSSNNRGANVLTTVAFQYPHTPKSDSVMQIEGMSFVSPLKLPKL